VQGPRVVRSLPEAVNHDDWKAEWQPHFGLQPDIGLSSVDRSLGLPQSPMAALEDEFPHRQFGTSVDTVKAAKQVTEVPRGSRLRARLHGSAAHGEQQLLGGLLGTVKARGRASELAQAGRPIAAANVGLRALRGEGLGGGVGPRLLLFCLLPHLVPCVPWRGALLFFLFRRAFFCFFGGTVGSPFPFWLSRVCGGSLFLPSRGGLSVGALPTFLRPAGCLLSCSDSLLVPPLLPPRGPLSLWVVPSPYPFFFLCVAGGLALSFFLLGECVGVVVVWV